MNANAQERFEYDYILTDARIYDGSGNPWYKADVGITDGVIQHIGKLDAETGKEVIALNGLYLSPGFIDIHSHSYGPLAINDGLASEDQRRREAPNLVSQGITTVFANQDGRSPDQPIKEQLNNLSAKGIGVNAGLMIGHNYVRAKALGDDYQRLSTAAEIQQMQERVTQAMQEGAFGLSSGLEYVPGRWSNTNEVVALVQMIAPYGGVYIAHQRSEAKTPMLWLPSDNTELPPPTLLDAIEETIEIGERTGATVVASHLKSRGANYWGGSKAAISLIQQARDRGVSIYADQYPYNTSGSDGNTRLIPYWALNAEELGLESEGPDDYTQPLIFVLQDSALRKQLYTDIKHSLAYRGGGERIIVFEYPDSTYIGKSIAHLADQHGITIPEMVVKFQMEGFKNRAGGARLRSFSMHEDDLNAIAKTDWTATSTDGMITLPEDGPNIHARYYGTFPRKIYKYAITNQTISIAHAIRSSTSLPAQIMGLKKRGLVQEGYYADLVVFDKDQIRDRSTFFEPHQHSSGIHFVFVNGVPVMKNQEHTHALAGKVLKANTSE